MSIRTAGIAYPVALVGPDGFDWVTAWLGIVIAGAVAVPLHESAPTNDLRTALVQCKARHVICGAAPARSLSGAGVIIRIRQR